MRARNIKPSLFKNELLAVADPIYTVIFAGLWCLADRRGRLEDRPARIHFDINPGRAYETTVASLNWLSENGFISRYEVNGARYIQIVNFEKHQNPHHKEPESVIPPIPGAGTGTSETNPETSGANPSCMTPQPEARGACTPHAKALSRADSGFLIPDSSDSGSPPTPPSGGDRRAEAVQRVFEHWQQVHQHPNAKLDEKRRKVIRKALEHYTEQQLCECISGYRNSPHHMGQNDRRTVYDEITLFLRDAAHIDAGLRFAHAPPPKPESPYERLIRLNSTESDDDDGRTTIDVKPEAESSGYLAAPVRLLRR